MDLLGPFPPTENGSTNILVITDRFSKLSQVTPLSLTTARAVAPAYIDNYIIPYGLPVSINSDNGPQLVAFLSRLPDPRSQTRDENGVPSSEKWPNRMVKLDVSDSTPNLKRS